jgi:ribonuclease HI
MGLTVYTDGGARGNPGPAGIGVVITDDGRTIEEFGAYIGEATNNQAEYAALLAGLDRARKHTEADLVCILDSELVVKQLKGEYKVKSEELKKLAHQVRGLEGHFKSVSYRHTRREGNTRADELVNQALDAR